MNEDNMFSWIKEAQLLELLEYLRGLLKSPNLKFAFYGGTNECAKTE